MLSLTTIQRPSADELHHTNECMVCYNAFNPHTAVFFPCKHWVCAVCAYQVIANGQQWQCPLRCGGLDSVDANALLMTHKQCQSIAGCLQSYYYSCSEEYKKAIEKLKYLAVRPGGAYAYIILAHEHHRMFLMDSANKDAALKKMAVYAFEALKCGNVYGLFILGQYYECCNDLLSAVKAYVLATKRQFESRQLQRRLYGCCERLILSKLTTESGNIHHANASLLPNTSYDDQKMIFSAYARLLGLSSELPESSPWALCACALYFYSHSNSSGASSINIFSALERSFVLLERKKTHAMEELQITMSQLGGNHPLLFARACLVLADKARQEGKVDVQEHYLQRARQSFYGETTHLLIDAACQQANIPTSNKRPFYF